MRAEHCARVALASEQGHVLAAPTHVAAAIVVRRALVIGALVLSATVPKQNYVVTPAIASVRAVLIRRAVAAEPGGLAVGTSARGVCWAARFGLPRRSRRPA